MTLIPFFLTVAALVVTVCAVWIIIADHIASSRVSASAKNAIQPVGFRETVRRTEP